MDVQARHRLVPTACSNALVNRPQARESLPSIEIHDTGYQIFVGLGDAHVTARFDSALAKPAIFVGRDQESQRMSKTNLEEEGKDPMSRAKSHRLTQSDLAAYRRDGYIVPKYRLPAGDLARLQALTAKIVAENPHLADQTISTSHIPGAGNQNLKSDIAWLDFAIYPAIVDIVEQIVGPDIILWGTNVWYKRALKGPATPWHRDGPWLPVKPLATTTVWIAIYDSNIQNGCLRIIPGSHIDRQIGEHENVDRSDWIFGLHLDPNKIDEQSAVDIVLEAGQMVIFDVYTVHGARHNQGTQPRAGYAVRFFPSTSYYDHDAARDSDMPRDYGYDVRPLLLVRGVDRSGRNDFRRAHPQDAGAH
jgi:hypothetical protein